MSVGRDMRSAIFNHVGDFSEQEVSRFGAPSLITRTTNDVQQVQTLVLTTCTMLVSAPLLSIGGIVMAIRLDPELSRLIAVSVPLMMLGLGLIMARMVPLYRTMQVRIDGVNRVLREQLTGIRVVRAFVREELETHRFAQTNADVTEVNLRAGRLMALMFPVIMIVLNVSSVAVIWFGAFRIEAGSMQVGTLIAFLTYLMQILMAVMMATFILTMIPRAAVSAERIQQVLQTPSSVRPPAHPVTPGVAEGRVELRDVGFSYPGAERPVVSGISFVAQPGQTLALIGSTGVGQVHAHQSHSAVVRCYGGHGADQWCGYPPAGSGFALGSLGLVPQSHFSSPARCAAICCRARRTPPTTKYGVHSPLHRRRTSWSSCRAGWTHASPRVVQCFRWPKATACHCARAGKAARDLPVRRFVLGPGYRNRGAAASGAQAANRWRDTDRRCAARLQHCRCRPDSRP